MTKYENTLKERVVETTNHCFESATRKVLDLPNETQDVVRHASFLVRRRDGDIYRKTHEQISELYLTYILQLPTKTLEEIIIVHNRKLFIRAEKTLEYIRSELARRGIMGDNSSQSDTTDPNAKVDQSVEDVRGILKVDLQAYKMDKELIARKVKMNKSPNSQIDEIEDDTNGETVLSDMDEDELYVQETEGFADPDDEDNFQWEDDEYLSDDEFEDEL